MTDILSRLAALAKNDEGDLRVENRYGSLEARLARKSGGHESKLAYCGNVLVENRNGLVVDTELVVCSGKASATQRWEWRGGSMEANA